ncbi:MAG TPA: hypothetical protein VGR37_15895, partial [Longimicrobiaceae bacterium]|nr:hypothetical protein [Longimicrobiaceae bacterium]
MMRTLIRMAALALVLALWAPADAHGQIGARLKRKVQEQAGRAVRGAASPEATQPEAAQPEA